MVCPCNFPRRTISVLRQRNESTGVWDWYLYYSYRGKDGTLPGIRLATSHDGKSWTRRFNEDDPRGMGQIFESTPNAYYEWHQIQNVKRHQLTNCLRDNGPPRRALHRGQV